MRSNSSQPLLVYKNEMRKSIELIEILLLYYLKEKFISVANLFIKFDMRDIRMSRHKCYYKFKWIVINIDIIS